MAAAAMVQQELLPLQVPRPVPRRDGSSHFLALLLLGASLVVFSVTVEPPVHAGFGLAGFLLWLTGMSRLLLFGQIGRPFTVYPAALAAATAKLAVDKVKRLFFGAQEQAPAPDPAAAPA